MLTMATFLLLQVLSATSNQVPFSNDSTYYWYPEVKQEPVESLFYGVYRPEIQTGGGLDESSMILEDSFLAELQRQIEGAHTALPSGEVEQVHEQQAKEKVDDEEQLFDELLDEEPNKEGASTQVHEIQTKEKAEEENQLFDELLDKVLGKEISDKQAEVPKKKEVSKEMKKKVPSKEKEKTQKKSKDVKEVKDTKVPSTKRDRTTFESSSKPSSDSVPEPPVKRGRGRPRKHPLPANVTPKKPSVSVQRNQQASQSEKPKAKKQMKNDDGKKAGRDTEAPKRKETKTKSKPKEKGNEKAGLSKEKPQVKKPVQAPRRKLLNSSSSSSASSSSSSTTSSSSSSSSSESSSSESDVIKKSTTPKEQQKKDESGELKRKRQEEEQEPLDGTKKKAKKQETGKPIVEEQPKKGSLKNSITPIPLAPIPKRTQTVKPVSLAEKSPSIATGSVISGQQQVESGEPKKLKPSSSLGLSKINIRKTVNGIDLSKPTAEGRPAESRPVERRSVNIFDDICQDVSSKQKPPMQTRIIESKPSSLSGQATRITPISRSELEKALPMNVARGKAPTANQPLPRALPVAGRNTTVQPRIIEPSKQDSVLQSPALDLNKVVTESDIPPFLQSRLVLPTPPKPSQSATSQLTEVLEKPTWLEKQAQLADRQTPIEKRVEIDSIIFNDDSMDLSPPAKQIEPVFKPLSPSIPLPPKDQLPSRHPLTGKQPSPPKEPYPESIRKPSLQARTSSPRTNTDPRFQQPPQLPFQLHQQQSQQSIQASSKVVPPYIKPMDRKTIDWHIYAHHQANHARIVVFNLTRAISPFDLDDVFKQYGPIERMWHVDDISVNKRPNLAFIEYKDPRSAQKAVEDISRQLIKGVQVGVDYCSTRFDRHIRIVKVKIEGMKEYTSASVVFKLFHKIDLSSTYGPVLHSWYNPEEKEGFIIFNFPESAAEYIKKLRADGYTAYTP